MQCVVAKRFELQIVHVPLIFGCVVLFGCTSAFHLQEFNSLTGFGHFRNKEQAFIWICEDQWSFRFELLRTQMTCKQTLQSTCFEWEVIFNLAKVWVELEINEFYRGNIISPFSSSSLLYNAIQIASTSPPVNEHRPSELLQLFSRAFIRRKVISYNRTFARNLS